MLVVVFIPKGSLTNATSAIKNNIARLISKINSKEKKSPSSGTTSNEDGGNPAKSDFSGDILPFNDNKVNDKAKCTP